MLSSQQNKTKTTQLYLGLQAENASNEEMAQNFKRNKRKANADVTFRRVLII